MAEEIRKRDCLDGGVRFPDGCPRTGYTRVADNLEISSRKP
jgi:hypothetical protein